MAEGDTNFTNVDASGNVTAGTGLTVTSGGATVTAGGVTVTAGDVTASSSNITGAAFYGPTLTTTAPDMTGFQVDGSNPVTTAYIRLYDWTTSAWRNCYLANGTFTAI